MSEKQTSKSSKNFEIYFEIKNEIPVLRDFIDAIRYEALI